MIIGIVSIVLILVAMLLIPIGTAKAGSWVAGTLNYNGSINYCEYNIVASSNLAYDHKFSSSGFKIQMIGVRCGRNIWTTFKYDVDFTLYRGDEDIDTYKLELKIIASKDILKDSNNHIMFESSNVTTKGAYRLEWHGKIISNVTADCNGSYSFEII